MDKPIDKDSFWLRIGPLVGPIMIYFLFFIILFKTTEISIVIPLVAFFGLICSHVFRWKGVVLASLSLGFVLINHFLNHPSSTWGWTIVLCLSAVSSFVVTVLCLDSTALITEKLFIELQDYKNTITHLGQRLADSHINYENEQNQITEQYELLKNKFTKTDDEKIILERKVKLVSEELKAAQIQQEKIQQILFETREQNAVLSDAFATLQENGKGLEAIALSPEEWVQVCDLQKKLENSHHQNLMIENQFKESNEIIQNHREQIRALSIEISKLKEEKSFSKVKENEFQEKLQKLNEATFDLEIQLQDAESMNDKKSQELMSLSDEIVQLKEVIFLNNDKEEELKNALQEQFTISADLEEKLQEAKSSTTRKGEEVKALSNEILALQTAKNVSESKINELTNTLQIQLTATEDYKVQLQKLSEELLNINSDKETSNQNQKTETVAQELEIRRLNGLYNQLKSQFVDKSNTLNATRKELFLAGERWEAHQKDLSEMKLQEDLTNARLLQKNLKNAELEFNEEKDRHLLEIAHLESLLQQVFRN